MFAALIAVFACKSDSTVDMLYGGGAKIISSDVQGQSDK
jgi:hypothetical protein